MNGMQYIFSLLVHDLCHPWEQMNLKWVGVLQRNNATQKPRVASAQVNDSLYSTQLK